MGCDIHTMAETGFEYEGKVHWSAVNYPVFDHEYFNPEKPVARFNYPYDTAPYGGRNYRLFAFLADVRNGRGFAGVDTGDRVTPIAEPRGVPDDASDEWKEKVEEWGADFHSASYFTLAELKAADWDQVITQRGCITEEAYLKLKLGGFKEGPDSWSGWISGDGVSVVTAAEYEAGARGTHVQYQWEDTMRNYSEWFLEHTLPGLERNAPKVGDHPGWGVEDTRPIDENRIRMVFAFDN